MSERNSFPVKTALISIGFGYLVMFLVMGLWAFVLTMVFGVDASDSPQNQVPLSAMLSMLLIGIPATMAGGYACAAGYRYVEPDSPPSQRRKTLLLFAALLMIASIPYTLSAESSPQPIWYLGVIIAQGPLGVLLGGYTHERFRRQKKPQPSQS